MRGYFGALMRSSGLAIARGAPAIAQVEPRVVELETAERRPAEVPVLPVQTTTTRQPALRPVGVPPGAVAHPAHSTPPGADGAAREPHAAPAGAEPLHPGVTLHAADESPAAPAARPTEGRKRDLGQDVIYAAMRWVAAADTSHVHDAARLAAPNGQSSPAVGDRGSSTARTTPAPREHDVDRTPERLPATPAPAPEPDLPGELTAARAVPARSTSPIRAARQVPDLPLERDDRVEVSIGAIHVRVEAPAPQTVAMPAPTPPEATPHTDSATVTRGALSRRALRRI